MHQNQAKVANCKTTDTYHSVSIHPIVVKAQLFMWFHIPEGKHGQERFVNVTLIDVSWNNGTVGITTMVLNSIV